MTDVPALLSCQQCKKRKIKCDKIVPRCSACSIASISCHPVQRARLARGRTGNIKHKNVALADKVARLENLVGRLEAQIHADENVATPNESGQVDLETNAVRSHNRVEDLVAKEFWIALSKEVTGLRETLEGTEGEDDQQLPTVSTQTSPAVQDTFNLLFGRGSHASHHTNTLVTQSMKDTLLQLYFNRVDILFKVTHLPTVTSILQNINHDDTISPSDTSSMALEWCIYFMAASTLSDQDCEQLDLGPKIRLIDHCRLSTEVFLSQSNLLVDPTFTTLQAFTVYLMGLRTSGQGTMTWTLIALAVRLGNALDLSNETDNTLSALEVEQRRRVWFGIGLLDSQAAFGRGSLPLLSYTDLKFPPLNINDIETGARMLSDQATTEMSFSCLTHQALLCQRKLCSPSIGSWHDRAAIVISFEATMTQTYAHRELSNVPIERYTATAAKDMTMNMYLLLHRPPYKVPTPNVTQQLQFNPASATNILNIATTILQNGLSKQLSPEFHQWSWFAWPRWYALAIVLVELASVPIIPRSTPEIPLLATTTILEGDVEVERERSYIIALHSFANHAQSTTELTPGNIWTPITRLMARVQRLRGMRDHHNGPDTSNLNTNADVGKQTTYLTPDDHHINTATVNPEVLWTAFLEDLSDTSSATATSLPTDPSATPPTSTAETSSTWSLMPYLPILPHLGSAGHIVGGATRSGGGDASQGQEQAQGQGQARRTAMEDGREGRSVLGRVW